MTKFPAFTLLEVVLSMFLVSLLGAFSFYVLQDLQDGWRSIGNGNAVQQEVIDLSTALRRDIDGANVLRRADATTLICVLDSMTVRYVANAEGVSRVVNDGTTFHFDLPTEEVAFTYHKAAPELVASWQLKFNPKGSATVSKSYAVADIIREQQTHVHSYTDRIE